MSVSSTTVLATGTGNNSNKDFAFSFKLFLQGEIQVYLEDSAGSDEFTLQTITTHYTVSFDADAETGTVTFVTAPGSGIDVVIIRASAKTQGSTLTRGGALPAATLEDIVDRLTLQVQELSERLDRAAVQPAVPASPAAVEIDAPVDGKIAYWALESGVWHLKSSSVSATV